MLPTDLYDTKSFVCDNELHLRERSTGCCAKEHASECGCDVGRGI